MKLEMVSVAPPGPPAVTLMTMSASFNSKMTRSTIAVALTGSIRGNVISQNDCQGLAPSTFAASLTSDGNAWRPASSRITTNGIQTQLSMTAMLVRAIHGEVKKAGFSQPIVRARGAAGPNGFSLTHFPNTPQTLP